MSESEFTIYLTKGAQRDIEGIKDYTLENYGEQATDAYLNLVGQALQDLQIDPFRPGSRAREEIATDVRSYHISLSRERANSTVKVPRHFILYFTPQFDRVDIAAIRHEAQDLARNLPGRTAETDRALSDIRVKRPERGRRR
jgi:toxin ParE1/3/4